MKTVAILGSTGSIGANTLDVIARHAGEFEVTALACESNIALLARQARRFNPKAVCAGSEDLRCALKKSVASGTKVFAGEEGLREIVGRSDVDIVVLAISGTACLVPLVEAVKRKKRIALANKEALVSAGPLVTELAGKSGSVIIPVDSEHSAIFQCIDGRPRDSVSRIYLTASGGPLLKVRASKFDAIPVEKMLEHPRWKMGNKITIDSATMMNKGLEIIEAQYLFGIDEGRIEVLIHPEAIIHSMVEFIDGAILAQMGVPDMRLPIQYALTYPDRRNGRLRRVDFSKAGKLSFMKPDTGKFPCLGIARAAVRSGGTALTVLCAADEEVVRNYLEGAVKFSDIPKVIEKVLSRHKNNKKPSFSDIVAAGEWAKEEARSICYH